MTTITIRHTMEEGTVVDGDPRPHQQALKDAGFRYSRNVGWFIRGSRDRKPRLSNIEMAAIGLRRAGFEVEVEVEQELRPTAIREADRADRVEDRQDALLAKAHRKIEEANGHLTKAKQIADMIPLGQPILVDHYSARRHRKDLARIDAGYSKGFAALDEGREAERKAKASEVNQDERTSGPLTIRRIDRLEAELRDVERRLEPCEGSRVHYKPEFAGAKRACILCRMPDLLIGDDLTLAAHGGAAGEYREGLITREGELQEEIAYWKAHLESLKADGYHEWGPADFQKGDRVNGGCTVVRVNKKSLTVQHDVWPKGMTHTLPYSKVKEAPERSTT